MKICYNKLNKKLKTQNMDLVLNVNAILILCFDASLSLKNLLFEIY